MATQTLNEDLIYGDAWMGMYRDQPVAIRKTQAEALEAAVAAADRNIDDDFGRSMCYTQPVNVAQLCGITH